MLPLRTYQALPSPSFDDATMKGLSEKGYAWARGEVEDVAFRWLSPRKWTLVGRLPDTSQGGFVPAMAFVDKASGAMATLRYARVSWEFDPGDLLDVADPRPFDSANAYSLGDMLVAERAGRSESKVMTAAAYRLGPHAFMIASEAPRAQAQELMEPLGVLNSGLRIDAAPAPAAVEPETACELKGLSVGVRTLARSAVEQRGEAAMVATPYGRNRSEVLLRLDRSGGKVAEILAREEKAVDDSLCRVLSESLRFATTPPLSPAFAGPVLVENLDTEDGRELSLVAGPLAHGGTLVVRALYPAPDPYKPAWLAARYALAKLLRSTRLVES